MGVSNVVCKKEKKTRPIIPNETLLKNRSESTGKILEETPTLYQGGKSKTESNANMRETIEVEENPFVPKKGGRRSQSQQHTNKKKRRSGKRDRLQASAQKVSGDKEAPETEGVLSRAGERKGSRKNLRRKRNSWGGYFSKLKASRPRVSSGWIGRASAKEEEQQ